MMVMETFTWKVLTQTQGSIQFAVLAAEFGEGYSAVAVDGLKRQARRQSWPIQVFGTLEELADVQDFLDRHAGAKRFLWWPPGDAEPSYFRAAGYQRVPHGGLHWTLQTTFTYAGAA